MIWEGKELKTFGEVGDAAVAIAKSRDRGKAREFLEAHAKGLASGGHLLPDDDPYAVACSNIGYWAGYMGDETRKLIFEVFDVSHPVFGRKTPTPDEAFQAGVDLATGKRKL